MSRGSHQPPSKIRRLDQNTIAVGRMSTKSIDTEVFVAQYLETGAFDVTFMVEGQELHAHKAILRRNSETFNIMFSKRWSNKDEPIKIANFSYDNFKAFITLLYSGEYVLSRDNIEAMIDMAEYYNVQQLKDGCDDVYAYPVMKLQEAIGMYDIAKKYSLMKSKTKMLSHIVILLESLKNPYIDKASIMELVSFESSDEIFETICRWAANLHQTLQITIDVQTELSPIIEKMRLTHFTPGFYESFLVPRRGLFADDQWLKIEKGAKFPIMIIGRIHEPHLKLRGKIFADQQALERLNAVKFDKINLNKDGTGFYWKGRCKIPQGPCAVSIEGMAPFYLVINRTSKNLCLKVRENVDNKDFILAEMFGQWDHDFEKDSIVVTINY